MVSLFRRLADLGHLEELKYEFVPANAGSDAVVDDRVAPDCVIQELIRTAHANSDLKVLHLDAGSAFWSMHLTTILEGLKDHKGLCALRIDHTSAIESADPGFSHIRELILYNRFIDVTNGEGDFYTDGTSIDDIYALNRFYRGAVGLADDPPSERPLFVATALVEGASNDFRRSALLLSNHTDALVELVQFAQLDDESEGDGSSSPSKKRQSSMFSQLCSRLCCLKRQ